MKLLDKLKGVLNGVGNVGRSATEAPDMNNYKSDDKYLNYLRFKVQKIKEKNEKEMLRKQLQNYEKARDRKFMFENKISNPKQNINILKQKMLFVTQSQFKNKNMFANRNDFVRRK